MTDTPTTRSDPLPPRSTLLAVFDDRLAGENAVRDLEAAGFDEDQIGFAIRGSDATFGGMITDASGTKDGKGAIAGAVTGGLAGGILAAAVTAMLPGVGPVLAAGTLAMFAGYAAAGTAVGGIIGALSGLGYSEEEARYYEQMFNEGKAILAVKPGARTAEAVDIVRRRGGYDLQAVRHSPIQTTGMFSAP